MNEKAKDSTAYFLDNDDTATTGVLPFDDLTKRGFDFCFDAVESKNKLALIRVREHIKDILRSWKD